MASSVTDTMGASDEQSRMAGTDGEPGEDELTNGEIGRLRRELERTRALLRRSRDDLDVFSQLTSGYWWLSEHGGDEPRLRAWATRNFTRITGHTGKFVEGLARGEGIHDEDAERVRAAIEGVVGGRDHAAHEFRLYARDGSLMWVRQRIQGSDDGGRRLIHASGELVTDRKRTEDALGHVEARFLSLVEHAPNVILTIDLEGTILFVNRRMPADPREPWELIGSSVFDLAELGSRRHLRDACESIVASKLAREFDLQGRPSAVSGDGGDPAEGQRARWYEVQGAPVIRGGEVVAITMILTDVTDRRDAEQALRRSESRWRFFWENVPDRISELDAQGRVIVTNRPIGSRAPNEIYGTPVFEHLGPAASVALRRAMELADATREPSSYEIELREGEDGEPRWWSNRVVPYDEGGARGYLLIGTDISDRKAAERERANLEAQLRQQQKLESIGTLASGVAHEINNPIQSIMNYADLVRIRAEPGGAVADFAGEIVGETERVANIVRSLLAFARQEKEHHSPARLIDIIESTLTLMRAVLRRDHISLSVDVSEDLPKIKCRSQQLQQVFMNLLGNARDALNARYPEFDENKTIAIEAHTIEREGEPWVQVVVEDHGGGIPANVIERVFDPFFTTKGRDEGTGLGLSVSHGIIREHRGELEVQSEVGEYTRFRVSLRVDNGWGVF